MKLRQTKQGHGGKCEGVELGKGPQAGIGQLHSSMGRSSRSRPSGRLRLRANGACILQTPHKPIANSVQWRLPRASRGGPGDLRRGARVFSCTPLGARL